MKKSALILVSMIAVLVFIGCSKQDIGNGMPKGPDAQLSKVLTPQVGEIIDLDLAVSWISGFEQNNQAATLSYLVNRATIENLLGMQYSGKEIDGLRFMKAFNDQNEEVLVIIPVQGGNDLWFLSYEGSAARQVDQGAAFCATGPLSYQKAHEWVESFVNTISSSETHRSYFVGREALGQLIDFTFDGSAIDALRFYKALKEDGKETLVIAPVQDMKTLGVLEHLLHGSELRVSSVGDESEVVYFEYMKPCPSTCDPD